MVEMNFSSPPWASRYRAWVGACQRFGEHELSPQQPDPLHRQRRGLVSMLGHRNVDIQARGQRLDTDHRGCRGLLARLGAGCFDPTGQHPPAGAVHGDQLAITQHLGGLAGADHTGHPKLPGHDRGMTGHAPTVGDQRGGPPHRRHPIWVGHGRHQDLTVGKLVALRWSRQHPHPAGRHTG